ncbi:filamentous hemagglutinin N-terminal domain-containing protein [Phormidium tenue FACHB-886]|nr:filamentous hemagglutinin N-terminal domain-containing protein [Phormidium tenue FACHB-886]
MQSHQFVKTCLGLGGLIAAIGLTAKPMQAQLNLTPDSTAGSRVESINATTDRIIGGTRPQNGANLFHSFSEFNVPEGRAAVFAAPDGVQNILSRVTGSDPSDILGTLGAEGTANLFLMNPNGILFGRNARLDVGGSFVGTTATAIQFGTQGFFAASAAAPSPLLTVSPSALLFNQITTANPAIVNRAANLQVPDGRTLALVGGQVRLEGSTLRALGGGIELGGAIAPGVVGITADDTQLNLSFPDSLPRADVSIANDSELDVRAANNGNIAIYADDLNISGGSSLQSGNAFTERVGGSQAGEIVLNATGATRLSDRSQIINQVGYPVPQTIGNNGNIRITTGSLLVSGGSIVESSTFGRGNAGDIEIVARDRVLLDGFVPSGENEIQSSGVVSIVYNTAQGQGGDIRIRANSVAVRDAAAISAFSFGQGNTGDIEIVGHEQVLFEGATPAAGGRSSNALTFVFYNARGQGGDIRITADRGSIQLSNGGEVLAFTAGQGNAGRITLTAGDRVSVDGYSPTRQEVSAIRSQVIGSGVGQSDDIQITADEVFVTNGGSINAGTDGRGDAGDVILNAGDRVVLDGIAITPKARYRSAISAAVYRNGVGQGGTVWLSTDRLSVSNGAAILAQSSGEGDAGDVEIRARGRVSFDGVVFDEGSDRTQDLRSGIFTLTDSTSEGNGGTIRLSADTVSLSNGAELQASTAGIGNAGSIRLDVGSLTIRSGANLDATTGGIGNGGNLLIVARDRVLIDGFALEPVQPDFNPSSISSVVASNGQGQGGSIRIFADRLSVTNGGELVTTTQGRGNAGNISLSARRIVFDGTLPNPVAGSSVAALTVEPNAQGRGGTLQLTADSLSITNGARLFANTFGQGRAGSINLSADRMAIDGSSRDGQVPSGIFAEVGEIGKGQGGNIRITTDSLTLSNRASLSASTTAESGEAIDGGDITIQAQQLRLDRGANLTASSTGTGRAGTMSITAEEIDLSNGASLSAGTRSTQGGDMRITADRLRLQDNAEISAATRSGRGGNISLNAANISLNDSRISATTRSGRGGNVEVNTSDTLQLDRSRISASTNSGQAGSLQIEAAGLVQLEQGSSLSVEATGGGTARSLAVEAGQLVLNDRSNLTVSSPQGQAGNLTVAAGAVSLDRARLSANTGADTPQNQATGNITVQSPLLTLNNQSRIETNATSEAQGGNIRLDTNFIAAQGNSDITADAINDFGGQVIIDAQGLFGIDSRQQATLESDITATSARGAEFSGVVQVNTPDTDPSQGLIELPAEVLDRTQQVAEGCGTEDSFNQFVVTGRGGLPPSPTDVQASGVLVGWATLPMAQATEQPAPAEIPLPTTQPEAIAEAQGWITDAQGRIVLIAQSGAIPHQSISSQNCSL